LEEKQERFKPYPVGFFIMGNSQAVHSEGWIRNQPCTAVLFLPAKGGGRPCKEITAIILPVLQAGQSSGS
jgi:hypothetical protein